MSCCFLKHVVTFPLPSVSVAILNSYPSLKILLSLSSTLSISHLCFCYFSLFCVLYVIVRKCVCFYVRSGNNSQEQGFSAYPEGCNLGCQVCKISICTLGCIWYLTSLLFLLFETDSHVSKCGLQNSFCSQDNHELFLLLPLFPECQDYRHSPLFLVLFCAQDQTQD